MGSISRTTCHTNGFRLAMILMLGLLASFSFSSHADSTSQIDKQEFQQDRARIDQELSKISLFKTTDPERYATQYKILIKQREKLLSDYAVLPETQYVKTELAIEYKRLAEFQRYVLHKPDEAIVTYQAIPKRETKDSPSAEDPFIRLAIIDTLRFDKHDPQQAAEQYRLFLTSLPTNISGPDQMQASYATYATFMRRWLEHEIDFLKYGKQFSGVIDRNDGKIGKLAILWLQAGPQENNLPLGQLVTLMQTRKSSGESFNSKEVQAAIDALPASQFNLAAAFWGVFELPPEQILRFFAKHDPAGYITATMLSIISHRTHQLDNADSGNDPLNAYLDNLSSRASVKLATDSFFRARSIRVALDPDPHYISPDKTWTYFIASARSGETAKALSCFGAEIPKAIRDLISGMSHEELRKMADSFTDFSVALTGGAEYREAGIVRQVGNQTIGGFINFGNEDGEWKIEGM